MQPAAEPSAAIAIVRALPSSAVAFARSAACVHLTMIVVAH
jgi:hypothetical protein